MNQFDAEKMRLKIGARENGAEQYSTGAGYWYCTLKTVLYSVPCTPKVPGIMVPVVYCLLYCS